MIFQLNKQISTMLIRRKHLSFHGQAGTCILTGDEDGDEFREGCPRNKFVMARGSAISFFFLCHSPNNFNLFVLFVTREIWRIQVLIKAI